MGEGEEGRGQQAEWVGRIRVLFEAPCLTGPGAGCGLFPYGAPFLLELKGPRDLSVYAASACDDAQPYA